ncbi:MAG: ABC transporter permease [Burkholderiaceae bacterium]|jgi:putative ABC transport system permease protein|nr:ABC transporter permease [Burkholderiaceae bacterium]
MKWLHFALLNVLRNKRRSGVTALIAAIGTAAILLAGGFALSTYEALAEASARARGHLIVGLSQHFTEDEEVALQFGLPDWVQLRQQLLADPQVRQVLPAVEFSGLISNGDKSVIALASGVDPGAEFKIKGPFLQFTEGAAMIRGADGVLLGQGLARSLGAGPGAGLTLLATTVDGVMNAVDVRVAGVVATGATELDKRLLYADLDTSARLLASDKVSAIGVFLDRIEHTEAAAVRIAAAHPGLMVRTWRQQDSYYEAVRNLYNRIFGALGAIIALIVLSVVTNSMSMSVVERTRETGALRAIGTQPGQLVRTFAYEGLILGVAGAALGCVIALAVSLGLYAFPLEMPPPPGRSVGYPLTVSIDLTLYAAVALAVTALAGLTSGMVARKTVAKPIPEALAHI